MADADTPARRGSKRRRRSAVAAAAAGADAESAEEEEQLELLDEEGDDIETPEPPPGTAAGRERAAGGGGRRGGSRKHLLRLLEAAQSQDAAPLTLEDLGVVGVKEVAELGPRDAMDIIEGIFVEVAAAIEAGGGFSYAVPNRSANNQLYVPELDRIVLKEERSIRSFTSASSVRKTAIMTRVMQMVHEVLGKNIHTTKRDLFYADVKLFKRQAESDAVLDDIACLVGCTRTSLHVVASEKGVVVGRLRFREDGDLIDCARMGVGGKAIPPFIDKVSDLESDAEFILLVEKDAAFMRLAEDRFYNTMPCIIITAKGQPDVATRLFLRRCKDELKLPILGLVDADPYGLKILSVYMSGSKNMSYDSASLTTSDIKWLGIRPSDLDRYNIPDQCRLQMTDKDIKTGRDLLEEDFIKQHPTWHKELEDMIRSKEKAEIQALSAYGFQYLSREYLPRKIREGDWL